MPSTGRPDGAQLPSPATKVAVGNGASGVGAARLGSVVVVGAGTAVVDEATGPETGVDVVPRDRPWGTPDRAGPWPLHPATTSDRMPQQTSTTAGGARCRR